MSFNESFSCVLQRGVFRIWKIGFRTLTDDYKQALLRQKAQKKIFEMKYVVSEFSSHVEEGIERRKELQGKVEAYLKALDENGKKFDDKVDEDETKKAMDKIEEMRSLVGEFARRNEEGIKRRTDMQEKAEEYIRALDNFRLRLETCEPPNKEQI